MGMEPLELYISLVLCHSDTPSTVELCTYRGFYSPSVTVGGLENCGETDPKKTPAAP